jgi:hypothetical protein
VATYDTLNNKLAGEREQVGKREDDYRAKVRKGWVVFEGTLMPSAGRERILAERQQRAEEARRVAKEVDQRATEELKRKQEEEKRRRADQFVLYLLLSHGTCYNGKRSEHAGKLALPYMIDQALRETGLAPNSVVVEVSGELPTTDGTMHRCTLSVSPDGIVHLKPFDASAYRPEDVTLTDIPSKINVRVCIDLGESMNKAWDRQAERAKESFRKAVFTAVQLYANELIPDVEYTWHVDVASILSCEL